MQSFKISVDGRDFVVLCLPGRPKALLDRTVAEIYEVQTMHINQAVKRNPEKFPEDFCFELTWEELKKLQQTANSGLKNEVITNCDNLGKNPEFHDLKFSSHLPKAFTHLGCNMLATVLKSPRAVQRAIQIIRTFSALESGGFTQAIQGLQLGQKRLEEKMENLEQSVKNFEQVQKNQNERIERMEANLEILLWNEKPSVYSPIVQLQKKVREIEEKLDLLLMKGNFKSLQMKVIYMDVQQLRSLFEMEIARKQKDSKAKEDFYFCEEEMSLIKWELERLEKKLETMLFAQGKSPGSLSSGEEYISATQAQEIQELVKKKAKKSRRKIAQIWNAFKKHFGIARYKYLPQGRFHEALEWIR